MHSIHMPAPAHTARFCEKLTVKDDSFITLLLNCSIHIQTQLAEKQKLTINVVWQGKLKVLIGSFNFLSLLLHSSPIHNL